MPEAPPLKLVLQTEGELLNRAVQIGCIRQLRGDPIPLTSAYFPCVKSRPDTYDIAVPVP